jgi:hypothetical protein
MRGDRLQQALPGWEQAPRQWAWQEQKGAPEPELGPEPEPGPPRRERAPAAGAVGAACALATASCPWLTESRLRCMRMSIGAVRLRTGTWRTESRFFLAIVGGRISS